MRLFYINFFLIFFCFINNIFSWTSATTLTSAVENDASNCSCVVNDDFKGIAVWQSNNISAGATRIGYSLFDGSSWGTRSWLSTAFTSTYPSVAINESNEILVVWDSETESLHSVKAIFYNGSSWGSVNTISDDSFDNLYPKVGIDSNGKGIVVWVRCYGDALFFQYDVEACYFDGSSWSETIKNLQFEMDSITQPKIAMNDAGNAIALWSNLSDGSKPTASYYNQSSGWAAGWGSSAALDITNAETFNVTINNEDDGFAIWKVAVPALIKASKYTGSWQGTADTLDSMGSNPDIALNDGDNAIAVWRSALGPDYIYASNYNGSSWTISSSYISTGAVTGNPIPTVAIDSSDDGISVWGGGNVQRAAYDTTWQSAASLSSSAGATAVVDTNAAGSSMAVWESTGSGIIQASTDDQGPPV